MDVFLGKTAEGNLTLPIHVFRRHMVCLGASGSGKTVACKTICEEFIRKGVPVIAIDPQGDIASLAHHDPNSGLSRTIVDHYRQNAEVVVWTPASSVGVPLSFNPVGAIKTTLQSNLGYEESLRAISLAADNIAALLDYNLSDDDGRLVAGILNMALSYIYEENLNIDDFTGLADFFTRPPSEFLQRVESIASRKNLVALAKKIRLLTVGVKKLLFELGKPLDIEEFLGLNGTGQSTRLSVIYLNTLSSQEEKEFFIAQLATALYQWMLGNPSEEIQALFYIDEVAPFLPPVRKPACKDILKLLFKQARKYGIGCLVASQNPGDIDYTALAQCSTWLMGRMVTRQDIKKVEQILKSASPVHCSKIIERIPSLDTGKFLLFCPDEFEDVEELRIRRLITQHKTLDEDQIRELVPDPLRKRYLNKLVKQDKADILEDDELENSEQLSLEQRILKLLAKEPACYTSSQVAEMMAINPATARKYLGKLTRQVVRHKCGKGFVYWHTQYSFLPQYGLFSCVDVAKLQLLEPQAIRLAEKRLSRRLIFFDNENVEQTTLEYLPLWQVHFTEALPKTFLFMKSIQYKNENIYFHVINGQVCIYDRNRGFFFQETPKEKPSFICDLDDICTFESIVPGELKVDWKFWKKAISEKELQHRISRKFQIGVHKIAITFLPVWKFEITDKKTAKKRTLSLDGVTGMPIKM